MSAKRLRYLQEHGVDGTPLQVAKRCQGALANLSRDKDLSAVKAGKKLEWCWQEYYFKAKNDVSMDRAVWQVCVKLEGHSIDGWLFLDVLSHLSEPPLRGKELRPNKRGPLITALLTAANEVRKMLE